MYTMGGKQKKKGGGRRSHKNKAKSSLPWAIGDEIVVHGLQQATQYNGKIGTVISIPSGVGSRFGVSVDGSKIAILPTNMKSPEDREISFENVIEEESAKTSMNADQLEMMRTMMSMLLTDEQKVKVFGRQIKPLPDFRKELQNEGYGLGVDSTWADQYLRTAFEQSYNLPHVMELAYKREDYEPSYLDLMKRLVSYDRTKLDWYFQRRNYGDIFPRTATPYSSNIRHSYSNQTYRKEILHLGTTHVAVGFVDLGILFEAEVRDAPNHGISGPLQFLGIELSPYAVAKTLLVWEMINQSSHKSDLQSVMQVWFSSTWDEETEMMVKSALKSLCESNEERHPKVVSLLNHWREASRVSLADARSQWASRSNNAHSYIAHFERKQDRMAMARYELSGDFGFTNRGLPVCGNTIMCSCSEDMGELAKNETVFSAFHWKTVFGLMSTTTTIIMEAAQIYAMERLEKLRFLAKSKMVTVSLVCGKVEEMVDFIAASKPWTMSWSNVIDYIDYSEFHRLARACSIHGDTLHFGYSMNWTTDVFGVSIMDYIDSKVRKMIIEKANECLDMTYDMFQLKGLLRFPPPTNPINTTSFFLGVSQYENWAEYFFDIGRRQGPCQVGNLEHVLGCPLSSTGGHTVSFSWTYDPEINLKTECPK